MNEPSDTMSFQRVRQQIRTVRFRLLGRKTRPIKRGIIVSFPKSGRTWLRIMLDELGVRMKYMHDGGEHSAPRPIEELRLCSEKIYTKKPVVFLLRDPRDTAVSGYFQKTLRRDGYAGSIGDFIRDPLHGVEKIVRYNLTWLESGEQLPAFMAVTYEQMRADTHASLRRILTFLGAAIGDSAIESAVKNNTLEKMRLREANGHYSEYKDALTPGDVNKPDSFKVRRGKVGGYIDYLSSADIAYCDAILKCHDYFQRVEDRTRPSIAQLPASSASAGCINKGS
jgi:hypothetical protein